MIYELEIEGKIVGKERPRVNLNNGRVYTPNKTKDYENYIRECFCLTYPSFKQIEGRVSIEIVAFRTIPKNSSKNRCSDCSILSMVNTSRGPDIIA